MPNPPKPTQIKILSGSAAVHPERTNRDEPQPGVSVSSSPPSYLPRKGIPWQTWFRLFPLLTKIKILTDLDKDALALGCIALDDYLRLRDGGPPREADAAWKRYWKMLEGFGMTPSARTRIKVVQEAPVDPVAEWAKAQ